MHEEEKVCTVKRIESGKTKRMGNQLRVRKTGRILFKYAVYLFLVVLISFFLPRMIPGSPLSAIAGEGSGYSGTIPAAALKQFEEYYAPELPMHMQFARYLKNLFRLDLGYSFFYKTPVIDRILGAAGWTLRLSLTALLLASVIGITLGAAMALSGRGHGVALLPPLLAVQSVPTFLLAAVLQIVLAYKLRLFPATGAVTPGMLPGQPGYLADMLRHMTLPLIILTISEIPSIAIFAYGSTMKIKRMPYVAFARYLNISPRQIRWKFIIKNIMPDLMGKLNIQAIMCIMGSMFVEAVFSFPGLGQLLKNATNYRDYPLMQGILLISCLYGIGINLIFEMLLTRQTRVS